MESKHPGLGLVSDAERSAPLAPGTENENIQQEANPLAMRAEQRPTLPGLLHVEAMSADPVFDEESLAPLIPRATSEGASESIQQEAVTNSPLTMEAQPTALAALVQVEPNRDVAGSGVF